MRRRAKIASWAAAALVGLPMLALAGLMILGNTDIGRSMIAGLVGRLSGGEVVVHDLAGRFPDRMRVAQIELRDAAGVWARVDGLSLDWSPLRLLTGELHVAELYGAQVALHRLPASRAEKETDAGDASLPVEIALDRLAIDRLDLGSDLAGSPASLRLEGRMRAAAVDRASIAVAAERLDAAGQYRIDATVEPDRLAAKIDIEEPARGLIGGLARLPDLGALSISAGLIGPRSAETFRLALRAGELRLDGRGTVDLVGQRLDVDLSGSAPQLALSPEVDWRSVALEARVQGPFTAPQATGRLDIRALHAGAVRLETLVAQLRGSEGTAAVDAEVTGLHIPGPKPDLLAAAPVKLQAEAKLDAPARPVTFSLSHPLLRATGRADTAPGPVGEITVRLPDLAPLGTLAELAMEGEAQLTARLTSADTATRSLEIDGTIGITGGDARIAGAFGPKATIALAATQAGDSIALRRFALDGKALRVSASGSSGGERLDLSWTAGLSDMSLLAPNIAGRIAADGRLTGTTADMTLRAEARAELAVAGLPPAPLTIKLAAEGLPNAPSGSIEALGRFADAPLQLAAALRRGADGTLDLAVQRATWKSLNARGDLAIPAGSPLPQGTFALQIGSLADLAPVLGTELAGRIDARFDTTEGKDSALRGRLQLDGRAIEFAGTALDRLTLGGTVERMTSDDPALALRLAADGITTGDISGNLTLRADGPLSGTRLRLEGALRPSGRAEATIDAAATAQLPARALRVERLRATYQGETLRLLAPVRIDLAGGVALDRLRLGMREAVLDAAGRLSPELDLRLSLRNATAALVKPFVPAIDAEGTITAEARLRGAPAAPSGTIRVAGRGLRQRGGPAAALPAAALDLRAELDGQTAQLDGSVAAGEAIRLTLAGNAPLAPDGVFDLRTGGRIDLAALNPLLASGGRALRGRLTLDLAVAGNPAAPQLDGNVRIAEGEVQDFAQGIHISSIVGTIEARDRLVRLTAFSGRAGPGTITATGSLDLAAPGLPVQAAISARAARLPASDFITAQLDADLTLRGAAAERLDLAGKIHIARADINIPEKFPDSVAVLDVRTAGETAEPSEPPLVIGLDLAVEAPERIFVRGYGLDAEIGGRLTIAGTSDKPQIGGGFDLRRGTFSLAGQTLRFTSGKVSFDGTGLAGKLNPTLDLLAEKTAGNITARLAVTGYADAPKIQLSSTPELPQDEVLAHLLFGQSTKQLSPLQLAEIAQALASLGGGGGGFNPLASMRKGLGLDVLSVGGGDGGTAAGPGAGPAGSVAGTTVEAGKYVAEGVYVGTEQAISGSSRAKVQIDLTDRLKLESTVGTGSTGPATGATPENDPGSSVGLIYQFEY